MNPPVLSSSPAPRDASKKLVLFHRDFRAFTGGHLKVWDYFNHVGASPDYEPRVAFSEGSKWDATNPWFGSPGYIAEWEPDNADVLFLAGTDWQTVRAGLGDNKPIINLIQHQRHAEKGSELYGFLKNRALRICVSNAVADAIKSTGQVNGPVFVNPNGIELGSLPKGKPYDRRSVDVIVSGLKAPQLARDVAAAISSDKRTVECLTDWIPRAEYLARLADARIAVVLPRPVEGFYLPALEAMGCAAVVICPDCGGNRDFCHDAVNCFRPRYDMKEIVSAVSQALQQSQSENAKMQQHAKETALGHSLETERANFLRILARAKELW